MVNVRANRHECTLDHRLSKAHGWQTEMFSVAHLGLGLNPGTNVDSTTAQYRTIEGRCGIQRPRVIFASRTPNRSYSKL